jgi:tetratricopeptide (TPR) repeat protein
VRLLPQSAMAHGNLADVLRTSHHLNEAIAEYQRAIAVDPGPNAADFHNSLGAVLVEAGKRGDAVREFQEALRLRPDFPEARGNLARTSGTTPK